MIAHLETRRPLFRTLTGQDWSRGIAAARAEKNPVREKIAAKAAEMLWSESFSGAAVHAIPALCHDPEATGWIALCGAFCTGRPHRHPDPATRCPRCAGMTPAKGGRP